MPSRSVSSRATLADRVEPRADAGAHLGELLGVAAAYQNSATVTRFADVRETPVIGPQ
jgi:hypothetical protein